MKYNFNRAFTYFVKDNEYKKKIAVISLYFLLAFVFIVAVPISIAVAASSASYLKFAVLAPVSLCFAIVFIAAMQGYIIETGVLRLKNTESELPSLKNFWHQVFLCVKAAIGAFLLYLPVIVPVISIFIFDPSYFSEKNSSFSGIGFPLELLSNIIYYVLMFMSPALLLNFLEKNSPLEFLNLKKAISRIKANFVKYLILLGILFAVQFLAGILLIISVFTIIGIILLPAIPVVSAMVSMDFVAQFAEISGSSVLSCTENEEK